MRVIVPILRAALIVTALGVMTLDAHAIRLKDVGYFDGVRPNQLIGYGLVVGLDGTGDSERASFTPQSIEAMLSRMGIRVDSTQLTLRNVAAVMVTAELPPFSKPGAKLDVTVSSIGDARSLAGGTLLMTPLMGADGETYAVSQGPLKVGSSDTARRQGSSRKRLNASRIPAGALVEREVAIALGDEGQLKFLLKRPDFTTAARVADGIVDAIKTAALAGAAAPPTGAPASVATAPPAAPVDEELPAKVLDSATIAITIPEAYEERIAYFISTLESMDIATDERARVVVSSRTGAVVLGGQVRVSQVAIAYDGLTLEVGGAPEGANPGAADLLDAAPPAPGRAAAKPPGLKVIDASTTLADVVAGLNTLGVTAAQLIDILEALDAAGALHATLEVQ